MKLIPFVKSLLKAELPFFLATPALVWQVLFLFIPLLLIVVYSLVGSHPFWLNRLTFVYYARLFDQIHLFVLLRSCILASITAIICVVCAYPVAYYLAFYAKRIKNQLLFFLMLPFWISFLVQVYAWFFVLEKHGLINWLLLQSGIIAHPLQFLNTPYAILLVMIYCYIPFAIMPIYTSLEKFDKRLWEASADLGANQWQTFLKVTLPLSALGIRTAFFLVLVPSFGEFIIPALLGGDKQLYVGTLISHYFLSARDVHTGAAFTCVSGLVLGMMSLVWFMIFKRVWALRSHS